MWPGEQEARNLHPGLAEGLTPGKPGNMTEDATYIHVEGSSAPFCPTDGKAIFFIDDHGTKWVRFKTESSATHRRPWVCVPLHRVLWIVQ